MRRVLVVGGGGREHALVRALARSPQAPELLAAPGNAGIAEDGVRCLAIEADDVPGMVDAAADERCDLVVVGPEVPLAAGLVDALAEARIAAFGPTAAAARIEGSKAHAKALMAEIGIPTAGHVVLRGRAEADAHMATASYPAVLKADVLAAGKGVVICQDERQARAALDLFLLEERFGPTEVVWEEFLQGDELSLLALCDGERALPMAAARDYKRIGDGDAGPNTGGMGSFSPVPGIHEEEADELARTFHQPVVEELRRRGIPYHGVLYAGLMMTRDGPRALEYNCRFGDPETQAVLPRLRSDLLDLLERCTRPGGLAGVELEWSSDWAVTVVLAAGGYPDTPTQGDEISGLASVAMDGARAEVLHAGTRREGGRMLTAGGRVLNVTGFGPSAREARDHAYAAADAISFDGRQMRRDIAEVAVGAEVRA